MTHVMLSSTWSDLVAYREKVRGAMDRLRHLGLPVDWIGMEGFSASSQHDVRTEVIRRVQDCDLYVGVLGHRYGTISPTDGISFVELEYNEAVKLALPRLLFVIREDLLPSSGSPDDGVRLKTLRDRFLTDRLAGEFDSPDNLALLVAIALLPDLLTARDAATNERRAAATPAVPGMAASIALTASSATVRADGSSTVSVTGRVTDSAGNLVDGEAVIWSIAGAGTVNPVNTRTLDGHISVIVTPMRSVVGGRIIATCVAASSGAGASIALDVLPAE